MWEVKLQITVKESVVCRRWGGGPLRGAFEITPHDNILYVIYPRLSSDVSPVAPPNIRDTRPRVVEVLEGREPDES